MLEGGSRAGTCFGVNGDHRRVLLSSTALGSQHGRPTVTFGAADADFARSVTRGLRVFAVVACLAALGAGGAQARAPLQVGAVAPELLDPGLQDTTITLLQAANLGDAARVTVTWERGQTAVDPGILGDLRAGVDKASTVGIDVYLDVYPNGSSQTPLSPAAQGAFAKWTASIVAGLPNLRHVIVGNESNLNLFWLPQFGSSGQDLAASAYERLLARTYDAVKAASSLVEVVGGALAHSGTDRRGTGRDTHSPATFILDMGTAYRASGRTRPIMDALAYHPYMERSNLPPTFHHHPQAKTLTIGDYGKLVSVLRLAFDGTKQEGSKLPIVYDEFGVESRIPSAKRAEYTGTEPRTTQPVSEAMQARYYAQALQLAACQPTVRTFMVFRLIDSPFLSSWQSGVYYADRETPKSSRAAVAAAAQRARTTSPAGCSQLLAPKPVVDWKRQSILCDTDCRYEERYIRQPGGKVAAAIRGLGTAGLLARLARPPRIVPGRYRLLLRVSAVSYRANPFLATSPVVVIP